MARKTNSAGIEMIKSFEGCRLKAYKALPSEQYYTIGYGHYGPDVSANMQITQQKAEDMLKKDLVKFEGYVDNPTYCPVCKSLNENQFSALVSFTYNCGPGTLKKLCSGRTAAQISKSIILYNKANGKVLEGLNRRRKAETELFNKPATTNILNKITETASNITKEITNVVSSKNTCPYAEPTMVLKKGHNNVQVKWVQYKLRQAGYNVTIDGSFGANTEKAVKSFQSSKKLTADGIVGASTRAALRVY